MGRQPASKLYRTKRKTRDADQILNDDMKSDATIYALEHQKFDEYTPGLAQHYCIPCAKYFETDIALKSHSRKKVHKRQLRNLRFGPYTAEEASAGAGRDVSKYLAKAEGQEQIMKDRQSIIRPGRGEDHKKVSKRTLKAEMEVEEAADVPKEDDEISV